MRGTTALGLAATFALVACGAAQPDGSQASRQRTQPAQSVTSPTATSSVSTTLATVAKLSARQLAGQRVIYSYQGRTPPATLLNLIRHGEAAGVIFFSPNIRTRTQLRAVTLELERANRASPVDAPLLLMTDQEGGLVRRLSGAPEPSEKQIGASASPPALARAAGTGAAANLRSVGLNVNLAPVLDVFRRSGDFIDEYERSYSSSPSSVGSLADAFIRAQQRSGVAATAKHFPGLGAAARNQNTDEGPVTLSQSVGEMRAMDESPYRAAIAGRSTPRDDVLGDLPGSRPRTARGSFPGRGRTGAPPQAWVQRRDDHGQLGGAGSASVRRSISTSVAGRAGGRRSRPVLWPGCRSRQSNHRRASTRRDSVGNPCARSEPPKCRKGRRCGHRTPSPCAPLNGPDCRRRVR